MKFTTAFSILLLFFCSSAADAFLGRPPTVRPGQAINAGIQSAQTHSTTVGTVAGAARYMEILGLYSYEHGIGMNNQGIVNHFQRNFRNSPCFQDLAVEFYNEIKLRDERSTPPDALNGRPSLQDSVGQGRFSNLDSGWLWRRAMQFSNNNANLAMELIGMCGHDDVEQGTFPYLDRTPGAFAEQQQRIEELRQDILSLPRNDPQRSHLERQIRQMEGQSQGIPSEMRCPEASSVMYAPGSLGVDIPNSLKNEIAGIQAPNSGARSLPAKYYHVMGSAYMACQMVQEGSSANAAQGIQNFAAVGYRNYRLCQSTNANVARRNRVLEFYQAHRNTSANTTAGSNISRRSNENIYDFLFRVASQERNSTGHIECAAAVKNGTASESCRLLDSFGFGANEAYSDAQIQRVIRSRMDDYNASWLYQNSTDMLCRPTATSFNPPPAGIEPGRSTLRVCLDGFPQESCDSARNRLQTWEADLNWTSAQHRTGAEFATSNCTRNTRPMEELACEARDIRQGSGASPTTPRRQQGIQ